MKRPAELFDVLKSNTHAHSSDGMRIGRHGLPGRKEGPILTRQLSVRQKEALLLSKAIDLLVSGASLRKQGLRERTKSDLQVPTHEKVELEIDWPGNHGQIEQTLEINRDHSITEAAAEPYGIVGLLPVHFNGRTDTSRK